MKINHSFIRQTIQIVGVSVFLVSIFFKLKAIILMGGTKSINDQLNPKSESDEENEDLVETDSAPTAEAG